MAAKKTTLNELGDMLTHVVKHMATKAVTSLNPTCVLILWRYYSKDSRLLLGGYVEKHGL